MKKNKDTKHSLSMWLSDLFDVSKAAKYKKHLLSEILSFHEKLKNDIHNKIEDKNHLTAILNGLMGDEFEANNDPLAIKMSFRYNDQDISVEELSTQYDFNKNSGEINVLVHGLMGDEYMWKKEKPIEKNKIGNWLENNSNANILYLRYNTGRHISENGRALSDLLERVILQYGNEIKQINLIGHSMGGLIIRSSGYYADIQRQTWVEKLKQVFLIGVPNEGSYLAKFAFLLNHIFKKVDISRDDYITKLTDARSNGIKDLSCAYLIDEDWLNERVESPETHQATKVALISGVKYFLIAGVIGKKNNIANKYFGDGLVGSSSALNNWKNSEGASNIESVIFEKENHMSLLESKQLANYIFTNLFGYGLD